MASQSQNIRLAKKRILQLRLKIRMLVLESDELKLEVLQMIRHHDADHERIKEMLSVKEKQCSNVSFTHLLALR